MYEVNKLLHRKRFVRDFHKRCAHSFNFRYFTNSRENPVRTRFPWSNLFIIHQFFSLARDWSRRVSWLNMLQLKLRNIGVIFLNFQSCACCKNIWRIMNTIASIWRKNIVRHFLGHYLSLEAHIFRSFASGNRWCPRQMSERTFAPNEN